MLHDRIGTAKYDLSQALVSNATPLATAITGVLAAGALQAATITVTTLQDDLIDGQCSLRSAIRSATSNVEINACPAGSAAQTDTIVFAPGLSGTIQLQPGVGDQNYWDASTLYIGESVTIEGPTNAQGASLITISGSGAAPVLYAKYNDDWQTESVTLRNLTITGGYAPETSPENPGNGGGILSHSRFLILDNVSLTNNSARHSGGGLWHQPATVDGVLNVSNCLINGNTAALGAPGKGGGIGFVGGALTVNNCFFTENQTGGAGFGGAGGALSLENSVLTGIVDTFFVNNTATYGSGGAIHIEAVASSTYLAGNVFDRNLADLNGGAVFLRESASAGDEPADIQLSGNRFSLNEAYGRGGGLSIYSAAGELALDSEVIIDNQANRGGGADLNLYGTRLFINNGSIGDNEAAVFGGGLYIRANGGQIDINRSMFGRNDAIQGCGGALEISEFAGLPGPDQIDIHDSVLFSNTASCGGAIDLFLPSSSLLPITLSSSELSFNQANGAGSTYGQGGAIYFNSGQDSLLTVSNSTLSGNSAALNGGAVHGTGSGDTAIKYSTLATNNAPIGRSMMSFNNSCSLRNSIIASVQSSALEGATACSLTHTLMQNTSESVFLDGDGNLLDQDPMLGPLNNNGGQGWSLTHAPNTGSPAIDAGQADLFTPDFDQRGPGFPRVLGEALDMGAHETPAGQGDVIFRDRFGG